MFSAKVREQLKSYVYLYIDPRDDRPFYVGKGRGNRCFSHLKSKAESEKVERIVELRKLGLQPRIDILKYGLSEAQALLVEATAIDLIGVTNLTNAVRGHGSKHASRGSAEAIAALLDGKPVKITHAAVLITINKRYRFDMTIHELYDATRSAWKVHPDRHHPEIALAVYRGIVRGVFAISSWVEGGTTMRVIDKDGRAKERDDRWEFVGQVASEAMCRRYVGRSVAGYYKRGAQNPIRYVNC